MDGLLNLIKPPGMSSHDVVSWLRGLVGTKVGHTGTLDPLAAGVMVLCLGRATKLAYLLDLEPKVYRGEITLGVTTNTLDAEGQVAERSDASAVSAESVIAVLEGLQGDVELPVPRFSAVKSAGRTMYKMARSGEDMDVPIRRMRVDEAKLLAFQAGVEARALVEFSCARGTYVRSLAQAVGDRLGCGAYLSFLLRTGVGPFAVQDAATLDEAATAAEGGVLAERLASPVAALPHLPVVHVSGAEADGLRHGRAQWVSMTGPGEGQPALVLEADGILVCVAELVIEGGRALVKPRTVMAP